MSAQRFTDPSLPFHREVHNGCAIGTSIEIKARAYQDQKKSLQVQLNSRTDIALNLVIPLNKPGQLSVNARVNDQYTSEIQKPIHVPLDSPFLLHIRIDTHVSEIYFNNSHLLDYVHRVNPLEIKEVSIEGPLIVSEVLFKPPQGASLEPLPSYDESVAKSIVPEFQNLSISPAVPPYRGPEVPPPSMQPGSIPVAARSGPPPAGTVIPRGEQQNKLPYPEKNYPGGAPPLPAKKDQPLPYPAQLGGQPQVAQVAPQPPLPPISTMPVQNRPATSSYPPQITPNVPPPAQYPSAPQQYPSSPQQQTPGQYLPSQNYPTAPPTNVYPGPNPAPYANPYGQPGTSYQPQVYPQQQAVYPMYQPGFPQSYVTPTYPMYSYPSVYYDDCHVSCHPTFYFDNCHVSQPDGEWFTHMESLLTASSPLLLLELASNYSLKKIAKVQ